MDDDDLNFDFEGTLETPAAPASTSGGPGQVQGQGAPEAPDTGTQAAAQYGRNYRRTVCTYWLRGLCMKGDTCGFLHQFDPDRMPVCRSLIKYGVCKEPDCPYKHSLDSIQECNMYKLGFCVYGPQCRYRHTRLPAPPPAVESVEAAKPRDYRDMNKFGNNGYGAGDAPRRPRLPGREGGLALPGPSGDGHSQQMQLYNQPPQQQQQQQQRQHFQHDSMQPPPGPFPPGGPGGQLGHPYYGGPMNGPNHSMMAAMGPQVFPSYGY